MPTLDDITIRTELEPGDLGWVVQRHGSLYAAEHGYGVAFKSYVAAGVHEFFEHFDAELDRAWFCAWESRIVGSLFLQHRRPGVAQLRYFLVEPECRAIGLGNRLMQLFTACLRDHRYQSAYLWTTHDLAAAAKLYTGHGFQLTAEKHSSTFGKPVIEQRYDLNLPRSPH